MRTKIERQQSLAQPPIDHEHARELAAISDSLDRMRGLLDRVMADISCGKRTDRGRGGMTAEKVLRVFIIKQMHEFSYEELAFQLASTICYRAFCRIGDFDQAPKASTLKYNLKRLSPETIERINLAIVAQADEDCIEDGGKARMDCTNVKTNIHEPTDSTLLWDVVRVLSRLMNRARDDFGTTFCDHTRRAKRRMIAILHAGVMKKRVPLYRDLIKVTNKTITNAQRVASELKK